MASLALRGRNVAAFVGRRLSTVTSASEDKSSKEAFSSSLGNAKPFEEVPEVKGLPLIGSFLDYTPLKGFSVPYMYKHFLKRHAEYGDIYKEKAPGSDMTVFCRSKEDTEAMFRAESRMPVRPAADGIAFIKYVSGFSPGLINSSGDEWYRHRRVINAPLLMNKMVWKYAKEQQNVSRQLVEYISKNLNNKGEVDNFSSVLNAWAFEMSGTFLLNTELGMLRDTPDAEALELFDSLRKMLDFVAKSITGVNLWKYIKTKESKELTSAVCRSYKAMGKIIERERSSEDFDNTILGKMMKADHLSADESLALVYDVFGASVETTSQAAALVMYCLTLNDDAQEKLRGEVFSLPDEVTGRVLSNMEYMNAFIKEAVRLFPLSHIHSRKYDEDIVLSGYEIPAGTLIHNTSNVTLNRNSDYFENPEEFLPERWMKKGGSRDTRFKSTGPFGMGARACAGRRFAMQEIRLLMVEVLKKYRIEYHYKPIVSVFRSTGVPSEDPQFKFIPLD